MTHVVSKILDGTIHGFFDRTGGRSTGDFASLNMSIAVGDDPDIVDSNRAKACAQFDRSHRQLALLKQTHSTRVVALTERPKTLIEADAMVTDRPGLLLGILTADCAPVLLADPEAGIVGAAHAGWKGAAGGILNATVLAMTGLGADPARIRAVIGPTISGANYEVGPQTAAEITALDPAAARHLTIPAGGKEHFDIPGFLTEQLFGAGVGLVSSLNLCTYADPEKWFSHRYATHHATKTGRQIAIIGLS